MKFRILVAALLATAGVCTTGYGDLLDRMLQRSGCGYVSTCCDTPAVDGGWTAGCGKLVQFDLHVSIGRPQGRHLGHLLARPCPQRPLLARPGLLAAGPCPTAPCPQPCFDACPRPSLLGGCGLLGGLNLFGQRLGAAGACPPVCEPACPQPCPAPLGFSHRHRGGLLGRIGDYCPPACEPVCPQPCPPIAQPCDPCGPGHRIGLLDRIRGGFGRAVVGGHPCPCDGGFTEFHGPACGCGTHHAPSKEEEQDLEPRPDTGNSRNGDRANNANRAAIPAAPVVDPNAFLIRSGHYSAR